VSDGSETFHFQLPWVDSVAFLQSFCTGGRRDGIPSHPVGAMASSSHATSVAWEAALCGLRSNGHLQTGEKQLNVSKGLSDEADGGRWGGSRRTFDPPPCH